MIGLSMTHEEVNTMSTTETAHSCYCGAPTNRCHSGVWECQDCWDWRKLDGPAARYWAERIPQLMEQGPDLYDQIHFFPKADVTQEEVTAAFDTLEKIFIYSKAQVEAHK
jgi:ribosomal protein L37AE/L43A